MCTKFNQTWQDQCLCQGLPLTLKDHQHGDQGGPQERGLGGALHVDYYALSFPKYSPSSTKFRMITDRDKDYWDPQWTTIMETKGDLRRGDKEELFMVMWSFNFINMHQIQPNSAWSIKGTRTTGIHQGLPSLQLERAKDCRDPWPPSQGPPWPPWDYGWLGQGLPRPNKDYHCGGQL